MAQFSPAAVAFAAAFFACLSWALPASAANTGYTNEASFRAAVPLAMVESFESLAGSVRSLSPVVAPLLTVRPGIAPIGVQTAPDTPNPGFGAFATDGTHYLSVYLPNLAQGTVMFDLASPTKGFGLNLIDIGETAGTVTLTTDTGAFAAGTVLLSFPPTVGNGAVYFIAQGSQVLIRIGIQSQFFSQRF